MNSYLAASSSTWYLSPSRLDHPHQGPGERRLIVAGRVPQPLQLANLLGLHGPVEPLAKLLRHANFAGLVGERQLRGPPHALRFVALQYLPLAFLEHRDERLDAWPQAGDLARVEPNRAGQLLLGQLPPLAVHQHVLERGRHQIGRRLRGAGKLRRIVPLVRVNDAAEGFAIGHGGGLRVDG